MVDLTSSSRWPGWTCAAAAPGWRLLAVLLVGPALPLVAQDQAGWIRGTITDSAAGQPIEAATILVSGSLLRAGSNARGEFQLFPVPPGPQTLTVVAIGFRQATVTVTVPQTGAATTAIVMAPGSVELPGIVVTANRGEEAEGRSPASIAVISNREVTNRNVTTIDEALPYVPGISFNNEDISIRGSSGIANGVGSRVLLLLDGHAILTGDGGEVDFEAIPLLDLDRVEVVKGAYSALYGSNALGGVVNLITSPIGERPATLMRAHFGVFQIPERYAFTDEGLTAEGLGLQHSRRIGGIGLRLFGGRESTDGYTNNGASRRWLLRAKAGSLPGAAHPWDAYAVYANEVDYDFFGWADSTRPFELDTSEVVTGSDSTRNALGDRELANKLLIGATITPLVRARTLVRVTPYLNYNTLRNVFESNRDYHNALKLGGTVQVVVAPGAGQAVTLGLDGGYTTIRSNFLGARHLEDAAGFAQYEVELDPRLRAVLGVRVDYHTASGGKQEVSVNPKLAMVFRAGEQLNLRASVARGYRAASAIEQFVNTTQFGFQVIPNPSLRGEFAWAGEVGMNLVGERFWLDASLFRSEYRDLIAPTVIVQPGVGIRAQFANIGRARVQGLDAGVRMRLIRRLIDLQASYMLLDTRDLETDSALVYRSRHNVTGTVEAMGGLLAVDLRYRSAPEQVLRYVLDPRYHITLVDLRLQYRLLGAGLQLKISNLFQHQYTNIQERVPGAPRSISLTAFRGF